MPGSEPVPSRIDGERLDAIPVEHRRVIARWLCERANAIRPSLFCTPDTVEAIGGVLYGVAVELVDPLVEDHTVERSRTVLRTLNVEVQ